MNTNKPLHRKLKTFIDVKNASVMYNNNTLAATLYNKLFDNIYANLHDNLLIAFELKKQLKDEHQKST